MPRVAVSKVAPGAKVEPGVYNLRIDAVEAEPNNKYRGEPRPQLKWVFGYGEGDDKVTITSWTSLSYFEGNSKMEASRLYQWSILLGWEPSEDPEGDLYFDTDFPAGAIVQAFVEEGKNGWPKVTKILKVLQLPKRALEIQADVAEEANPEEANPEEANPEEANPEEANPEEANPEE